MTMDENEIIQLIVTHTLVSEAQAKIWLLDIKLKGYEEGWQDHAGQLGNYPERTING